MKRKTAKVQKVRKDGVKQAYHEAVGPKSSRADRLAAGPTAPSVTPKVDLDELRDAVAFDDYDAARAYGSDEREYVAESIEVHGGSELKVILTRSVYLPVGENYGAGWLGGEAEDLAQEAFERGDREVSAEDVEAKVNDTWTAERENAEENYFSDTDAFDGLRERLKTGAAEAGIDLNGVTVEEVETVEARDVRPDLGEAAQAELDALWEEADAESEDNEEDEEAPSLLGQVLGSPSGRRAQGLPDHIPADHPILDSSSDSYDPRAARVFGSGTAD